MMVVVWLQPTESPAKTSPRRVATAEQFGHAGGVFNDLTHVTDLTNLTDFILQSPRG